MNDVRMPIETSREGNKITKVCVEDIYKMINRLDAALDKAYNNSRDIIDVVKKEYYPSNEEGVCYNGWLIIGKGVSQPCGEDEFNEEIGNNIAFMKAKLNANLKKYNITRRVYNELINCLESVGNEMEKVLNYIYMDIDGIREYNPDYLKEDFAEEINEDSRI